MFSKAYQIATNYTKALILYYRLPDGNTFFSSGSMVVLNRDGWALTAYHVVKPYLAEDVTHRAIQSNPVYELGESIAIPDLDLVAIKLRKFDPESVKTYPKIKNPSNLLYGMSLCKLGIPFGSISTQFDETKMEFILNSPNLAYFPLDGILVRFVDAGLIGDNKFTYQKVFIETSTPNLKGQSGGPIFDVEGNLISIAQFTVSYPLEFNNPTNTPQYFNAGWGIHTKTLIRFLEDYSIPFDKED